MKKRYYLSMLSLVLLILVFDGIYFVSHQSLEMFLVMNLPHSILLGLLNFFGIYFLYKPIDHIFIQNDDVERAKKRIKHLTWYSTVWIFFVGLLSVLLLLLGVFFFQTASDVASMDKMPPIILLSVIPSSLYIYAVLPAFITYFLINDFSLDLKEKVFSRFQILYSVGKKRIGLTILFVFIILGFLPTLLVIIEVVTISMAEDEYAQFISINPFESILMDRFLILIGIIFAIVLITRSFTKPIYSLLKKIKAVQGGDFSTQAAIITEDEIGVLTNEFNEMVTGLKERDNIRQSLFLARGVQQNLLPSKNPQIDGLDIVGSSIYCDETGGDYYDFIIQAKKDNTSIGIAIGDVSGHGISSALLMAAVRSSLRQRVFLQGDIADIISDVNRTLVYDMEESGHFVTMFYMTIDPINKNLQYVRAGHDPAILYDPDSNTFEELGGPGMALGVDENWNAEAQTRTALKKGQIVLLCTDGIFEARNPQGEMFGKEPLYRIIRSHSSSSANQILKAVIEALNIFQNDAKVEDDVTMVIIKITT